MQLQTAIERQADETQDARARADLNVCEEEQKRKLVELGTDNMNRGRFGAQLQPSIKEIAPFLAKTNAVSRGGPKVIFERKVGMLVSL